MQYQNLFSYAGRDQGQGNFWDQDLGQGLNQDLDQDQLVNRPAVSLPEI